MNKLQNNLITSIKKAQNTNIPFAATYDDRDNIILERLSKPVTMTELGVLTNLKSNRFSYLTEPVHKLQCPYTNTVGMQFKVGTSGWYFIYGITKDGMNGFQTLIFRFPTKPNASASSSIFNISGYVIDNGKMKPFSENNYPIYTTCKYTENVGDISIKSELKSDNKVYLRKYEWNTTGYMKNINITIGFKNVIYNFSVKSLSEGVMQGDIHGCVPCFSGIGTNYWSFPMLKGNMTRSIGKNDPITIGTITGWFDHQWGILQKAPRSAFWRIALNTINMYQIDKGINSWLWTVIQIPDKNLFYTITVMPDKIQEGVTYNSNKSANKFTIDEYGKVHVKRNISGTLKVVELVKHTNYTKKQRISIDGHVFDVEIVIDGLVTIGDGSTNMEVPVKVYENDVQVGTGFIENNLLDGPDVNVPIALKLAGISLDKKNIFMPRKLKASQIKGISFLIFLWILVIIFFISLLIYRIIKKK